MNAIFKVTHYCNYIVWRQICMLVCILKCFIFMNKTGSINTDIQQKIIQRVYNVSALQ